MLYYKHTLHVKEYMYSCTFLQGTQQCGSLVNSKDLSGSAKKRPADQMETKTNCKKAMT